MSESIRLVGGSNCANRIERGIQQVEELIADKQYAAVAEQFQLCDNVDLSKPLDVMNFFSSISDEFAGVVQYHSAGDIEQVCDVIESVPNEMEAVAKFIRSTVGGQCNNYGYKSMVDYYKNVAWDHGSAQSSSKYSRNWKVFQFPVLSKSVVFLL